MIGEARTGTSHLPGLDGLRAIAALAVFLSNMRHLVAMDGKLWVFDFHRFVESGIGVLFFFLLSGYLLTLGFWRDPLKWRPWKNPFDYATQRASRLLPAYFVCLVALVAYRKHWQNSLEIEDTILHSLLLHNFAEFSFYGISEPLWTIPIQSQFYLLLPFILWLASVLGRSLRGSFVVLLLFCGGSYMLHFLVMTLALQMESWPFDRRFVSPDGFVLTKSTLAHMPIFIMGAAAGYLATRFPARPNGQPIQIWRGLAFWGATLSAFIMITTPLEDALTLPFGRFALPLLPTLVTMAILFQRDSGLLKLLESMPLRGLGTISFGLYLFHMPCLKIAVLATDKASLPGNQLLIGGLGFALTVTVAGVVNVFVERPIQRYFQSRSE